MDRFITLGEQRQFFSVCVHIGEIQPDGTERSRALVKTGVLLNTHSPILYGKGDEENEAGAKRNCLISLSEPLWLIVGLGGEYLARTFSQTELISP